MPTDEIEARAIPDDADANGPGETADKQGDTEPSQQSDNLDGQNFDPAAVSVRGLFKFRKIGLKTLDVVPAPQHEFAGLNEHIEKRRDRKDVGK